MKNPAKRSGAVQKDKFLSTYENTKIRNLPDTSADFSIEKRHKILSFLRSLPSLDLSPTGIKNIAKRFGTTAEHLAILIIEVDKAVSSNEGA